MPKRQQIPMSASSQAVLLDISNQPICHGTNLSNSSLQRMDGDWGEVLHSSWQYACSRRSLVLEMGERSLEQCRDRSSDQVVSSLWHLCGHRRLRGRRNPLHQGGSDVGLNRKRDVQLSSYYHEGSGQLSWNRLNSPISLPDSCRHTMFRVNVPLKRQDCARFVELVCEAIQEQHDVLNIAHLDVRLPYSRVFQSH